MTYVPSTKETQNSPSLQLTQISIQIQRPHQIPTPLIPPNRITFVEIEKEDVLYKSVSCFAIALEFPQVIELKLFSLSKT